MRALLTAIALLTSAGSPTETLKERDAEMRAALPPKGREANAAERAKLETIFSRTVDMRAMAEAALGERWKKMSEKQRKRLLGAFEKRFRSSGSGQVDDLRDSKVEYEPEQEAEDTVKVPTRVSVQGEPTEVVYTMRRDKDGWRIVDIAVDGVSTVENYRSSFGRVIAKEGVDGLIQRLEKGPAASRKS